MKNKTDELPYFFILLGNGFVSSNKIRALNYADAISKSSTA